MTFDELLNLVYPGKATGIRLDSRLVSSGDIFVAVRGTVYDGHDFINQALANGAEYIVCERPCHREEPQVIIVDDSPEAAAILAQASRGNPTAKLTNLVVTGTNGKTTVAYLARSIIQTAGEKCGLVGTIIYDTGLAVSRAVLTTPDCLDIAEAQSQMVKAGAKYMVIEASSHALAQNRLAAVDFKAAAFTNLGGDHLDYHKTKAEYLAVKTKLFKKLSVDATAVLNKQSPETGQIAKQTKAKILRYAVDEPADISASVGSIDINGTIFTLEHAGQKQEVKTPLFGRHNVSNCLAAAGLCLAAGFDLKTIATGLSALKVIPGRLENVSCSGRESRVTSHIFIDYAHTDDALKNVLSTLKPLCKGRLTLVFGCGGDRDKTKRPRMAAVAEQLADFVIVTSDNPRTERPRDIIDEIVAGFKNPDLNSIAIEPDRKKAIELAIKNAAKDDIVLIAGKGHENYQIIGTKKVDFDDKKVAQEFLGRRQ